MKEDVKQQIEVELEKRGVEIRNANAIDCLFTLFPKLDALRDIFAGSKKAIEIEKQKLTQESILDLLVGIDKKISGDDVSGFDSGLKILIENVVSMGDITGLAGNTSGHSTREVFKNPIAVIIKDAKAKGNITGIKLDVDQEMKVEKQVNINTNGGSVQLNPQFGEITFGKGLTDNSSSEQKMRVGLIDEGKGNTYEDCEMSGPDAGMIDRGEGTKVIRSNIHTNN